MTGVHNASKRVMVVDKLSHEQLRAVLVVGLHVETVGAEELFTYRMASQW